jgi:ubiquinone biosynthesis protein UbiJ
MKYREEADYNPSYTFTADEVRRLRDETAALSNRIADLIRQSGFRK